MIQTVNVNVAAQPTSGGPESFLVLSQNENGRQIRFRILGDDLPAGCTATFSGTKPDGNVYSASGTIDGNFVLLDEEIQMTAVSGRWDAKLSIAKNTENIMTSLIRVTVVADAVSGDAIPSSSELDGIVAECRSYAEAAKNEAYGSPLTASTAAAMTDQSRVYVYTGSETGYTSGHWYYYNGSGWADGGVYNATAVDTDTTLTIAGKAADAKKVGDELISVKEDLTATTGLVNLTSQYANGYIATASSSIDITNTHPTDTHMRYVCLECAEGDVFHVKGARYGAAYAIYCWVKADGTKISASADAELADWTKIVAPANTAYLVSNVSKSSDNYGLLKGQYLVDDFDALNDALSALNLYIDSNADIGYLSNTGVLTSPTKGDKTSNYIAVSEGDVLNIRTWATVPEGDTLQTTVCEYDSNKGFLIRRIKAGTSDPYIKWEYTAPSGVSYIRVSSRFFSDGEMMITRGAYDIGYVPASDDIAPKSSIDELSDGIESVKDGIVTLTGDEILTDRYSYGYIACHMSTININSVHQSNTYKYIVIPCSEGDEFNIIGKGDSTIYALYAFVDANGNKVSGGKGQAEYTDYYYFKIPANVAYLVSNVNVNYPYALIKGKLLNDRIDALEARAGAGTGLFSPLLIPATPKIAMHRGWMTQAPENTVPAFELAGQGGAWGIETDVYETTDGYFVISHDNDVSRMTDGTGKITEMTYAQTQECTIDAGANVDQYPNLKMPLLADYLSICRRYGCVPVIELKGVSSYSALMDVIREAGMEGSAVFTFYYDSAQINALRTLTAMPILLIGTAVSDVSDLIQDAQTFSDLWLSLYSTTASAEGIKQAHALNIPVGAWTIDNAQSADTMFRRGIDFAVSNDFPRFTS